jgi:hypothetical protein
VLVSLGVLETGGFWDGLERFCLMLKKRLAKKGKMVYNETDR